MHLRWRLAVVTGAGGGLGREVALRLARAGAGVVVVDPSLPAAEAVAAELRERRVSAWALGASTGVEDDVVMVAARARDLGGADLLVQTAPSSLIDTFLVDVVQRRGRSEEPGAVVTIVPVAPAVVQPCAVEVARVMWVVEPASAIRIVEMLESGAAGSVS